MRPRHKPIRRQKPIDKRQQRRAAGGVPPIAHQIHDDGEETLEHDAGVLHAAVGVVGEAAGKGAAGLGVGEDGVALGAEGEGEELGACGVDGPAWRWLARRSWAFAFGCGEERGRERERGRGRGETEKRTDVRSDAGEDDLGFVLGDDGGAEVGVVPGVHLAVSSDQGGVGEQGRDLLG